jgi:hypothetical protein
VLILEAVEARSGVDEDATLALVSECLCHGNRFGSVCSRCKSLRSDRSQTSAINCEGRIEDVKPGREREPVQ